MRKHAFILIIAAIALSSCSHHNTIWELVFKDDFNKNKLDETVWKRTKRGKPDWQNTQSDDPRCMGFRDGCLLLRGIVNDDLQKDTAHFLTGGIVSEGLKAFPSPGRYEIRARLHKARGAWPALWLMPFEGQKYHWPYGGEIDIMERLNGDSIFYQTIHSGYTLYHHKDQEPPHGTTIPFNPDDFNIFGVDIYPDSIVHTLNGKSTFCYPRIPEEEKNGQWPFLIPQFLLLDMQLGGSWIGKVYPEDLPVEMEVDWVKVYKLKDNALAPKTLPANTKQWNFDNLEGWQYEHQDTATIQQASLKDGLMTLTTRRNTYDRTKIHTISREHGAGDYVWRIYIPKMAPKGQASIAGFIYQDDAHELDFEIGYGKEAARRECKAKPNELLAYLTNQKHPYTYSVAKIIPGWHDLTLRLTTNSQKNYTATWLIDGKTVKSAPLEFGPADAKFHIYCSVENLQFLGDAMPTNDSYAKFNHVLFIPEQDVKKP